MTVNAGTVYVDVRPNTAAMTTKGSGGLGTAMKTAGALAAVAFAASFIKGGLEEAKEAEKVGLMFADSMSRGTEKFNSEALSAKFDEINDAMGVSDEQLQTFAAHFNNAIDFSAFGAQAEQMLVDMTRLTVDIAARTGKSTTAIEKTMTKLGTAPETAIPLLEKLGVLTQEQSDHAMKLVEAGKVEEAQMYAVQAANEATAGASAAQTTESEKMAIAYAEIQEVVGQFLLPVLNTMAGFLKTIFDGLKNGNPLIVALTAALGLLVAAIVTFNVYQKIAASLQLIWNAVMTANPIGLIVVAVAALVAGLVLFFTKTKIGIAIFKVLGTVFKAVWEGIKKVGLAVWNVLKAAVTTYFNIYKAVFTAVWNVAKAIWNKVKGVALGVWDAIKGAWEGAKSFFSGIWDGLLNGAKAALNGIITVWNNTVGALAHGQTIEMPGPIPGSLTFPDWRITPLAEGGIVTQPTIAMVGEAGPEAIVPLSRGAGGAPLRVVVTNPRDFPDGAAAAATMSRLERTQR